LYQRLLKLVYKAGNRVKWQGQEFSTSSSSKRIAEFWVWSFCGPGILCEVVTELGEASLGRIRGGHCSIQNKKECPVAITSIVFVLKWQFHSFTTFFTCICNAGRSVAKPFNCHSLTAEAWVLSRASPCWIYDAQCGAGEPPPQCCGSTCHCISTCRLPMHITDIL
jgi:hypothetical protein